MNRCALSLDGAGTFIHMIAVHSVVMTIVKVVGMITVLYGLVTAIFPMLMGVAFVFIALT